MTQRDDDAIRRMLAQPGAGAMRQPVQMMGPMNDAQALSFVAAILMRTAAPSEGLEDADERRRAAVREAIEVIALSVAAIKVGDLHRAIHREQGTEDKVST